MFCFFNAPDEATPFIMTNKHVVEGAQELKVVISTSKKGSNEIRSGTAEFHITEGWQQLWLPHPDPSIDLGGLAFGPLLNALEAAGQQGYGNMFSEKDILSDAELKTLSSIEDILMIGYPNNFYDRVNNQPITRRGITASDPKLSFNGNAEFVIDCSVFPGSSGSPVVLREKFVSVNQSNQIVFERRKSALLGLLWGGPQYDVHGRVVPEPVPVATKTQSKHLMNLGYVIAARKILDLKSKLQSLPGEISTQYKINLKPLP